jgi:lantibiotic modifying enzyme
VDIFTPKLNDHLGQLLSRTMALELNVARLQGNLHGDTPAERYREFMYNLREPNCALRLLEEYPVLARLAVECVDRWVDSAVEFLDRLCRDWEAIRREFADAPADGILLAVGAQAGDTHECGRAVSRF